jgi:hypothetical protein
MKKKTLVLVFSLIGISLFAEGDEVFGKWALMARKDKFGDPTGDSFYAQANFGEGKDVNGRKSLQTVGIMCFWTKSVTKSISIFFTAMNASSFPLNMLLFGPEPVTLYIKDSANKTYSFKGTQDNDDSITMGNNPNLLSLLRQRGAYKAVIEGEHWSCSFTFNGGLPQ